MPLDDVDLVSDILRMVPRNRQDQYELSGAHIPQSVWKLLEKPKCIEKVFWTIKDCEVPNKFAKSGDSVKKVITSFSKRIPKKGLYVNLMGARTRPKIPRSAVSMRRTVLRKKCSLLGVCRALLMVLELSIARVVHM
jgi:hypothetical protein